MIARGLARFEKGMGTVANRHGSQTPNIATSGRWITRIDNRRDLGEGGDIMCIVIQYTPYV
jgi:hypothetical protein